MVIYMGRLLDLIIFIIVVALLWWALTTVLVALSIQEPFVTIAVVLFIVIAVISFIDHLRTGVWFWRR